MARSGSVLVAALAATLAACRAPGPGFAGRLVDLTHPLDESTVFWPTGRGFALEKVAYGPTPAGFFYAANNFSSAEHCGTHMDAPIHFAEGGDTVDRVPLERLLGPAAVIDLREACAADRDHRLGLADLEAFERRHGRIEEGTILLVRTGWSERWPDRKRYLGSDVPGDASDLHFPGLSEAAARRLVERKVAAVGIDSASLDHGPSKDFPVHRVLAAANVPGLENLMNLAALPPRGASLIALPIKIAGGSDGPCRVVAVLPER
ncbi:MAG: cyclase family protein [Planctomycetes bacterium]|nr:cyclase family protein [Planctomycetota bacterium]